MIPFFFHSLSSRDEYDRYYRGGADDYYRRKDEPYRDPYREPWNGRREPDGVYTHMENYYFFEKQRNNTCFSTLDDRVRPEERRRNELYRQYYEELQRRYDSDRPVDCSVIVVNKAQKYVSSLLRFDPSSRQNDQY